MDKKNIFITKTMTFSPPHFRTSVWISFFQLDILFLLVKILMKFDMFDVGFCLHHVYLAVVQMLQK